VRQLILAAAKYFSCIPESSTPDVAFFRSTLEAETARLSGLCDQWEAELAAQGVPEDVVGQGRAAIGKAWLLLNPKGRFEQFHGLVERCESGGDGQQPRTTCQDLQGFWEMVYKQVEDIDGLFKEMEALKANQWVRPEPEPVKPAATSAGRENRRPKKPPRLAKVEKGGERKARTGALRDLMAAGRKEIAALKRTNNVLDNADLLARPLTPKSALRPVNREKEKVFDAGYFYVRSPLRTGPSNKDAPAQKLHFDDSENNSLK